MTLLPLAPAGSSTVQADRVQIVDGSGAQITSFGGGTQYADADAQATPTGTVAMGHDGSNVRAVTTDSDGDLQVDVKTMPTTTVQATNLDIRDLAAASDSVTARVNDGSGNSISSTSNALHVRLVASDVSSSGGTSAADDADFVAGTTAGTPAMGVYESTPTNVTDGDLGTVGITIDRQLKVSAVVASSALPSGAATSAKQDTIIGHVDGVETLLGTIDADTGNISTKIDTIAGAVSGTEVQVDVLTMPTTTVQATDLDIRDLTATDVVTANLSATDNAVLDNIDADTSAIQTAVELIDDTVATLGTTTYTETTTKGITIGAVRRDADTTLVNTTNEIGPLQMDANGRLKVEAFSGEALPVTDNGSTLSIDDGSSSITVDYATTGSGTATGALRVELPTNGTGVIATVSTVSALGTGTTGPQKAEDVASAGGDMGVAVMAARLDTPVANAGVSNDGDYTTPILDNYRKLWVAGTVPEDTSHVAGEALTVMGARRIDTAATSAGSSADWATVDASAEGALWVTNTPTTTSGCTIFRSIDLDESEEEVKATAGNVYGYYVFNAAASVAYLKFYNATAANVTVGTTTPVMTFPVPAGSAANVSFAYPISFSTAICAAVTTGLADNDTGAPAANAFIANILFK